eukprot:jgi/Chrzof1/10127/Cz04g29210.t1
MADMLQLPATARTQPNTAAIDNLQPISDDDAEPLTLGSHRLTSPLDRLSFMQLQSSCCSSSSSNAASSSPSLSQQETASVVCSAPTYSSLNRQQPNPSATATNNKGQLLARLASRKVAGREATALLHPTSPHTAISPDGKQANTRVVTHRKRRRQLRYVLTEACLQQGGTDSASPAHAWLPEDLLVDLTGQTSQPPLSSNQRQHMLRLGTLCKHGGLSFEVSRAVLTKCMESALNNNPEEPQRCMPTLTQLVAKYGELTVTEWMKRFPGVRRHTVDEIEARLQLLSQCLEVSYDEVLYLTVRCPVLLTLHRDLIEERFKGMCAAVRKTPREVAEMLHGAPALLAMKPSSLASKWAALTSFAASHSRWQQALERSAPKSLSVLLTYGSKRYLRYQYVIAHQLQHKQSFLTLAGWPSERFLQRYPDFNDWMTQQ